MYFDFLRASNIICRSGQDRHDTCSVSLGAVFSARQRQCLQSQLGACNNGRVWSPSTRRKSSLTVICVRRRALITSLIAANIVYNVRAVMSKVEETIISKLNRCTSGKGFAHKTAVTYRLEP
jgi:hypothetical protein